MPSIQRMIEATETEIHPSMIEFGQALSSPALPERGKEGGSVGHERRKSGAGNGTGIGTSGKRYRRDTLDLPMMNPPSVPPIPDLHKPSPSSLFPPSSHPDRPRAQAERSKEEVPSSSSIRSDNNTRHGVFHSRQDDLDSDWDFVSINSVSSPSHRHASPYVTSSSSHQSQKSICRASVNKRIDTSVNNASSISQSQHALSDARLFDPETLSLDLQAEEVLEHLSGHLLREGWGEELERFRESPYVSGTDTDSTIRPTPTSTNPLSVTSAVRCGQTRSGNSSLRSLKESKKKRPIALRRLSEQPLPRSAPLPPDQPIPPTPKQQISRRPSSSSALAKKRAEESDPPSPVPARDSSLFRDQKMGPGVFLTRPSVDGPERRSSDGHKGFFRKDKKESGSIKRRDKHGSKVPLYLATGPMPGGEKSSEAMS